MYKTLLSLLTVICLLPSCSGTAPHISVVCEENNVGNCIVKWEMTPPMPGVVKVYASSNPDYIPEENPVAMAATSDLKLTIVNADPTRRQYYSLVFNDRYRIRVASRNVNIPGIQNFRDLGGYPAYASKKYVRWGMVYRSAGIDSLAACSSDELKNIGIKTIIDLRDSNETSLCTQLQKDFRVIQVPIFPSKLDNLLKEIKQQKVRNDLLPQQLKLIHRELINNYTAAYQQIFDALAEKENYPIVIQCSTGTARVGIVSALLLKALGVDDDLVMEDYLLSSRYFNIPEASGYAYKLPTHMQEAITMLYSPREEFFQTAKKEVEQHYGSVNKYLQEGIGIDRKKLKQLRQILLTD